MQCSSYFILPDVTRGRQNNKHEHVEVVGVEPRQEKMSHSELP